MRKNDHRCPIGAPQGDLGQRGSGANNLPPGPFIFAGPPPLARLLASEKKPRRSAAGLKGGKSSRPPDCARTCLSAASLTCLRSIFRPPPVRSFAANGVVLLAKFDGEFASHSSTYAGTGTVRYPSPLSIKNSVIQ